MNFQTRQRELAPFRQPNPQSDLLLRVRHALTERARRSEHFRSDLFADPAWDILLQLYSAELSQEKTTVSQLAETANVPSTTTLRWIKMLECDQLIAPVIDAQERGRVHLVLTPKGSVAMGEYFDNAAPKLVPGHRPSGAAKPSAFSHCRQSG
jgi:DNA-binding MarR family transcriptional regulator